MNFKSVENQIQQHIESEVRSELGMEGFFEEVVSSALALIACDANGMCHFEQSELTKHICESYRYKRKQRLEYHLRGVIDTLKGEVKDSIEGVERVR